MSMSLVSSINFMFQSMSFELIKENVMNLLVFLGLYSRTTISGKLTGKTVIVTGGNRGIGYSLVKQMSDRGARVIIACRDITAGKNAAASASARNASASIRVMKLDLSSFKSVKSFAENFTRSERKLDILVNNAGLTCGSYIETEDSHEMVTQVNFYSPIMLTLKLLPLLQQSKGTVINVSSLAHYAVREIDFDRLSKPQSGEYDTLTYYAQSKVLLMLATRYLKEKLADENVRLITVDPGITQTDLFKDVFYQFFKNMSFWMTRPYSRTNDQSADSIVSSLLNHKNHYDEQSSLLMKDSVYIKTSALTNDSGLAKKLWSVITPIIGTDDAVPPELAFSD